MHRTALGLVLSCCAGLALAQTSPYAGQELRPIKALSEQEVAQLRAGEGMGFAKAAELNGYPGPSHVLELAERLGLTAEQRKATETLMRAHKARARDLGAALVAAERELDGAFAQKRIDGESLSSLTLKAGQAQAKLRDEHLRTHLEQTRLLTPAQVRHYVVLRGYANGTPGAPPEHKHADTHGGDHRGHGHR